MAARREKANMWHGRGNSGGSWPPAFPCSLWSIVSLAEAGEGGGGGFRVGDEGLPRRDGSGDQIKKSFNYLEHIPDLKCVLDLERVLYNKNIRSRDVNVLIFLEFSFRYDSVPQKYKRLKCYDTHNEIL